MRVAVAKEGRRVEERVVVKREVPDPAIYPEPAPGLDVEVEIQHRCIEALARHADVPVAPLLGWEPTGEVLGAPFYVMGHVDGWVPGESPPYPSHGWYAEEASPAERRALVDNGLAALAAVHAVDWRAAGLDFLVGPGVTPGTAHQLALWEAYAARELDGRVHEPMAEAAAWLHDHLPDDHEVTFCWGDPRPGNIFWRGVEVACTTDFEAAAIASPLQDLGWWLMFDRSLHPDGVRADGDPSLAEQRALYAGHAGIAVPDTTFHEVFAGYRYAAIVVRVLNRLVARGDMARRPALLAGEPGGRLPGAAAGGARAVTRVVRDPAGHPDDELHEPTGDDPWWRETCWFTFTVPERRLSGQLYPFMAPTLGVAAAGVYVWDDTGADPRDRPLRQEPLAPARCPTSPCRTSPSPTGSATAAPSPGAPTRWATTTPTATSCTSTLTFTAVTEPHRLGDAHIDQPGRYRGTIVLRGERIEVDAYGFRDRSWGPRPQVGPGIHGTPFDHGGYSYATASDDHGFHMISMDLGERVRVDPRPPAPRRALVGAGVGHPRGAGPRRGDRPPAAGAGRRRRRGRAGAPRRGHLPEPPRLPHQPQPVHGQRPGGVGARQRRRPRRGPRQLERSRHPRLPPPPARGLDLSRGRPAVAPAGLAGWDRCSCRPAEADDVGFLATMLGEAAVWRPEKRTPTGEEVMADPRYEMYLRGWPRPGDVGVVAEDDAPVGAAWYRTFTEADHAYGFVGEDVPELAIAVVASRRGEGIGRRLLVALIEASVAQGCPALSLSVQRGEPGAPPLRVGGLRAGREGRDLLDDAPTRRSRRLTGRPRAGGPEPRPRSVSWWGGRETDVGDRGDRRQVPVEDAPPAVAPRAPDAFRVAARFFAGRFLVARFFAASFFAARFFAARFFGARFFGALLFRGSVAFAGVGARPAAATSSSRAGSTASAMAQTSGTSSLSTMKPMSIESM